MVTLTGAEQAQPYVVLINTLQAAVDALNPAANNSTTVLWQYRIDVLINGKNTTLELTLPATTPLNNADSVAILFDIRNILANQVNILTNTLGGIT